MKVRDFSILAIFISLSFVLSFIKIFELPSGGAITLYLIPLMLIANSYSFKKTLIACIVASILQIIVGYVISPIQAVFDYVLPIILISFISLANNKLQYILITSLISVSMLLSYCISGVLFFGFSFTSSLIYNSIHFIPTIIISIVITNLIKNRVILRR